MTLPSTGDLRRLLRYLYLEPTFRLPLNSLQAEASGQPSAVWLRESLEAHRRVVHWGNDFRQSGLFEFEVGLRLMASERSAAAAEQFAMARRQWRFADDAALLALAELGLGLARQHNYEYEGALESYLRVEDYLADVEGRSAMVSQDKPERDTVRFVQEAREALSSAMSLLTVSLRSASEAQPLYVAVVEPPIIDANLTGDGLPDLVAAGLTLSFEILFPPTVAELSETILPVLQAIQQADVLLRLLLDLDQGLGVQFKQVGDVSPVQIRLEGMLPQTADLCARMQADDAFGEALGERLAALRQANERQDGPPSSSAEAATGAAARGQWRRLSSSRARAELAVQELCLQKAVDLLNNYALTATPHEERLVVAAQLSPALQLVAGAIADSHLFIKYSQLD